MKPAIIPVATMLAVHMLAPSARAAAPQDVPLQLTLPSPDPAQLAQATAPDGSVPAPVPATAPMYSGSGFIANWLNTANQAQAMQPHWMTPLVTVTPRLEQEIRYDQYWEKRGNGSDLDIFDAGKGLELIPTLTNEILINPPAYQEKVNVGKPVSGWLDDQFLVVKQRLLTANEQEGNYIVTAFLAVRQRELHQRRLDYHADHCRRQGMGRLRCSGDLRDWDSNEEPIHLRYRVVNEYSFSVSSV
jgi:hypothetical protein